eukprot:m.127500 g.127500  ORF g.127500 m.127500 type:complete len:609 (+) comp37931_c0_seq1:97-1923(+)
MDRNITYVPQHDLPDEIKAMKKEETICKFCGVSYLIHNEVKALEDKVKQLEDQLDRFRDAAAREEETREQLHRCSEDLQRTRLEFSEKRKESENRIMALQSEADDLRRRLQTTSEEAEFTKQLSSRLTTEKDVIRLHSQSQLETISALKQSNQTLFTQFKAFVSDWRSSDAEVRCWLSDGLQMTQSSVEKCKEETAKGVSAWQKIFGVVNSLVEDLKQERDTLAFKCKEAEELAAERKGAFQREQESLTTEVERLEMCLREELHKLSLLEADGSRNETKMSEEKLRWALLKADLEKRLSEADSQCGGLQSELSRAKQQQETTLRRFSEVEAAKQKLDDDLSGLTLELTHLKEERSTKDKTWDVERDSLMSSYKSAVHQLKETEKELSDCISSHKKEENRQNQQIRAMEEKLRSEKEARIAADMKLRVHQEQYKKVEDEVSAWKHGTAELNRKLEEANAVHDAEFDSHIQEVRQLKAEILQLQKTEKDTARQSDLLEVQGELTEARECLASEKANTNHMADLLRKAEDEIKFLKEVVQRECEERMELTIALETAKKKEAALLQNQTRVGSGSGRPTLAPLKNDISSSRKRIEDAIRHRSRQESRKGSQT